MRTVSRPLLEILGLALMSLALSWSAVSAATLKASHAERVPGLRTMVLLQFDIGENVAVGAASLEILAGVSTIRTGESLGLAQLSIFAGSGSLPPIENIANLAPRSRHFYVHATSGSSIFDVGELVVDTIRSGVSQVWMVVQGSSRDEFAQPEVDLDASIFLHLQEAHISPDAGLILPRGGGGAGPVNPDETGQGATYGSARLVVGPNPARGSTRISFRPVHDGRYRISVFDLRGREVFGESFDGRVGTSKVLEWSGMTNGGVRVAAGVYSVRVIGSETSHVKKFVLLP